MHVMGAHEKKILLQMSIGKHGHKFLQFGIRRILIRISNHEDVSRTLKSQSQIRHGQDSVKVHSGSLALSLSLSLSLSPSLSRPVVLNLRL
jgi:hypothetical protein